jgi:hypothetical protein
VNEQPTFKQAVAKLKKQLRRVQTLSEKLYAFSDKNQIPEAYDCAFDFAHETEELTMLARSLPVYTGHAQAHSRMQNALSGWAQVETRFTPERWFQLCIPALLPRKERGSPEYLRGLIYPAMKRFFEEEPRFHFSDCVIVFKHIYDSNRPEREYRDHDNIELNAVVDIIAQFVLDGDMPLRCFHFYCSAAGTTDHTEVTVVPQADFVQFLIGEKILKSEVEDADERPP